MTVMGEQVRPTRTSTPWAATPRRPRRVETAGSDAFWTELQHWMGPVEQESGLPLGAAKAVARIAERVRRVVAYMARDISLGGERETKECGE